MSRRSRLLLLLAVLVAGIAFLPRIRGGPGSDPPPLLQPTRPESGTEKSALRPSGRPAPEPDRAWIEAARQSMTGSTVESDCGPYRLITDSGPARFSELCEGAISPIENAYAERLGVAPIAPPRGTILLFSRRQDFRDYVSRQTGLARGYAAFSRASRGIVAVADVDSLASLATTLAHEIAHLMHRRAFGPDLPPWLSEGLADAVGDTATPHQLLPLEGTAGAQAAADRLLAAIDAGAQRSLLDLLELPRRRFDREIRSFDYEQSALLVRFLLLDPELGSRFRDYLRQLAGGTPYRPADLRQALGIPITTLEERFEIWLRTSVQTG